MRLLELTPAEIAFLAAPPASADALPDRLTRALAATLTARLRLPVRLAAVPTDAPTDAPAKPFWQVDESLATIWLTRRLGGQRIEGTAPFVPQSLIRTLDATLAECWLDAASRATPPPALEWQLTALDLQVRFAVQLPRAPIDMTRWAREVIRHG